MSYFKYFNTFIGLPLRYHDEFVAQIDGCVAVDE